MKLFFKKWINESYDQSGISSLIEDAKGLNEVLTVLKNSNINYRVINFGSEAIILLPDAELVIYDFEQGYGSVEDAREFIYSRHAENLKQHENFNQEFWKNPVVLYHATTEQNLELIKQSGQLRKECKTRGIGNRSVGCAVFTTMNHEDLLTGSYGNEIITIDTKKMKADGFMPFVSKEPEIEELESNRNLAYKLGIEIEFDEPGDLFMDTVIVYDNIPLKYLS